MKKRIVVFSIVIILIILIIVTCIIFNIQKNNKNNKNTKIKPYKEINITSNGNIIGKAYLNYYLWQTEEGVITNVTIGRKTEIDNMISFLNSKETIKLLNDDLKIGTEISDDIKEYLMEDVKIMILNDNKDIILEDYIKVENEMINIDTSKLEKNKEYYIQLRYKPSYSNNVSPGKFANYIFKISVM